MVLPSAFVQQTLSELKKVTWPKRDEVIRLTITTLLVSAIVGIFIGGVDYGLTKIIETVVK